MNRFQHIVDASRGATEATAETHRSSAVSNFETALEEGVFTAADEKRLRRLLHTMMAAAQGSAQRKLENLQQVIVPALISMGLAEDN